MQSDLDSKFAALGAELSTKGWSTDDVFMEVLSGDDDGKKKDPHSWLGRAFFLKCYGGLRTLLCNEDGTVRDGVTQGVVLIGLCSDAIAKVTDLEIDASSLAEVVVQIGIRRFCSNC